MDSGASPLVTIRRRLARLDQARFIEKIGGRSDAYRRPLRDLEDDQASTEPARRLRT